MSDEEAPVSGRRGRAARATRGRARFRTLEDSDSDEEEIVFDGGDDDDVVMADTNDTNDASRKYSPDRMKEALVSNRRLWTWMLWKLLFDVLETGSIV